MADARTELAWALDAFDTIQKLLGPERAIGYEDAVAYFKVHVAEKRTWGFARLFMDRKTPSVSVPLAAEQVAGLASGHDVTSGPLGWSTITLDNASQVGELAEMFRASYAAVRKAKGKEQ